MTTYHLIDSQTQATVGKYKTRVAASRAADRKDSEYGAIRYVVKLIFNS